MTTSGNDAIDDLVAALPPDGRLFDGSNPSGFERMTRQRFEALALWGLPPDFRDECEPASFWSTPDERLLALVYVKSGKDGPGLALIARDPEGRYRPFAHQRSLPTVRAAEDLLRGNLGRGALGIEPTFRPLPDQPRGTDLLGPIAGLADDGRSEAFLYLRDGVGQSAARELLAELGRWTPDLDGNLAREFQTGGYDARTWEIYLNLAFREMGLRPMHGHQAPDFHLDTAAGEVFVEATTANPTGGAAGWTIAGRPPDPPADLTERLERDIPLRFGSPLHSKMSKRYWDLDHVRGRPFVLAIADFHAPASMTWSRAALPAYLYGLSARLVIDPDGSRRAEERQLRGFAKGAGTIAPFFEQEGSANVSAVLFSNAGTIAKFNRMGARAGFGNRFVRILRHGGLNDPTPDAVDAIPFEFDVESDVYEEGWADELEMHHNPNALRPIPDDAFPGITHYRIEDGEGVWRGPSPRVLFSQSITMDLLGRETGIGPAADARSRRKRR